MRQRPQYLLQEFADRGHPVYFVDPREPAPRSVDGISIVNRWSDVPHENTILYVHYAPASEPASLFADPGLLYDISDDLSAFSEVEGGEVPDVVMAYHREVIAGADVVSAASTGLADAYRPERPDIVLAENGVDKERFSAARARPADLPLDDMPIAGYHGALADWRFDFDLFAATAQLLPGWRFVLVGPVDDRVAGKARSLELLPNVTLIGERNADQIGAYVSSFEVGTMWYPLNQVTSRALPMKLNEYLAAGVPCVSTPLPSCIGVPGVWVARNAGEYADAIVEAGKMRRTPQFAEVAAAQVAKADWHHTLQPIFDALDAKGLLTGR